MGVFESPFSPSRFPDSALFDRRGQPNTRNDNHVTEPGRLHDIEQKLCCWGYLSHYPDAERDVAWLLDQLAERDAHIAELLGAAAAGRMGVFAAVTRSGCNSSPVGAASRNRAPNAAYVSGRPLSRTWLALAIDCTAAKSTMHAQ